MNDTLLQSIQDVVQKVTGALGPSFTLEQFIAYVEQKRNKPLKIETRTLPVAITGKCIALTDCDMILIAKGLDDVLSKIALLHECVHLLSEITPLQKVLLSYRQFSTHYNLSFGHSRTGEVTPEEQAIELIGRILLTCISDTESIMPDILQRLYE